MAEAADQHTPTEWTLTRLFDYLRVELGKKKRALYEIEQRRLAGRLRVIVREYDADGNPKGKPFDLGIDKAKQLVYDGTWVYPRGLPWGGRCAVAEQNVLALWPLRTAVQPAPVQPPKEKAGPDPSKPPADAPDQQLEEKAGRPPPKSQRRRWRGELFQSFLDKRYPPDGKLPDIETTSQAYGDVTNDMEAYNKAAKANKASQVGIP
jgi:hypothetical protein